MIQFVQYNSFGLLQIKMVDGCAATGSRIMGFQKPMVSRVCMMKAMPARSFNTRRSYGLFAKVRHSGWRCNHYVNKLLHVKPVLVIFKRINNTTITAEING